MCIYIERGRSKLSANKYSSTCTLFPTIAHIYVTSKVLKRGALQHTHPHSYKHDNVSKPHPYERTQVVKHAHINSLMHDRPDWRRRAVPIKLYGDGVPVTGVGKSWSKTMATYTFSSLVATGKTHEIVFLVWACMTLLANDSVTPAFDTKSRFWKKIIWSLRACYNGCFPHSDSDGRVYDPTSPAGRRAGDPLCGGFFFIVFALTGDLEWFYKDRAHHTDRASAHTLYN